jgi:hypothetical protein
MIVGCSNNKETESKQIQINIIKENNSGSNSTMSLPTAAPTEQLIITPEITKAVNTQDNELLNNITELCKSPRGFDTDGEQRALSFLIDKMTEYGYETYTQEFSVYHIGTDWIFPSSKQVYFEHNREETKKFETATNLIATTANPDEKKTLYITAHYDTTDDTNGIRDNGSGVVTAMEIARQLQGMNLPINIEFVFFSAEEAGIQGSAYFVSQLTQTERDNALGCINIDVVGQKGDSCILLKTCSSQINVLSILMDEFHDFKNEWSEASDHKSFYMGEIPAIYFADDKVKTKDNTNVPLEELDIEKLKELTKIICNFIINFDVDHYYQLIKNSYTKEYTDLPNTGKIEGYLLIQVNKILREDGAGSMKQYIWKKDDGNQVIITEMDSRFLKEDLVEEMQSFQSYNDYITYKVIEEDSMTIVKCVDSVSFRFYELKGSISKNEALELLENQSDVISNVTFINALK